MSKLGKQSFVLRPAAASLHRSRRVAAGEERGARGEPAAASSMSLTMRLAAEIETLKDELALARAEAREWAAKADIDGLLDILNRRGFERELNRALAFARRYATPAALIYVDLDRFKPINDSYGHAAGDAVLCAAARALVGRVRASDLVGRLGGDELALFLWNMTPEEAAAKVAVLERAVEEATVDWDGLVLSATASAGFAMFEPEDDCARLIRRADRAMYARKREKQTILRDNVGS